MTSQIENNGIQIPSGRSKARLRVTFVLLEQMLGLPEGVHITAVAPSDPGSDTFAINLRGPGLPLVEEGDKLPFLAEVPRGN